MSKKSPGCLGGIFFVIIFAICYAIYASGTMWYVFGGIGLFLVLIIVVWVSHTNAREREKRIWLLNAENAKHSAMIRHGKTVATRMDHCRRAIEVMEEIQELDPSASICKNSDELLLELHYFANTIPIQDALQRVEKADFKGQKKEALNCLLDAIFHCEKGKLTDDDIKGLIDPGSGNPVTIEYLKSKAMSLGWTPNK